MGLCRGGSSHRVRNRFQGVLMAVKWKKGPPPSIGWWPSSVYSNDGLYRWWDGKYWSVPTTLYFSAIEAANRAATRSIGQADIRWAARPDSWPARSRT